MSLNDLGSIGDVGVHGAICDVGVLGAYAGDLGAIRDVCVLK